MFKVNIRYSGLDEALQSLDSVKKVISDLSTETKMIGDFLLDFFQNKVFDSEGGVLGSPWVPLTTQYAVWKAKHYGNQGILIATGTLRASWQLYTSTDSIILQNEAQTNGIYYGAAHQQGAGRLPVREIMDFDDNLLNQIRDMFIDSLNTRIESAVS